MGNLEGHVGIVSHISTAFVFNAIAALGTLIGGLAICSHQTLRLASPLTLATILSVSGGVTAFLSLIVGFGYAVMEFGHAFRGETENYDSLDGDTWAGATITFGIGILIVYSVDFVVRKLTPMTEPDTPNQGIEGIEEDRNSIQDSVLLESPRAKQGFIKMDEAAKDRLQRMGVLSGIAIAMHNIPSGIGTFTATIENPAVGLSMALGVGLHNIAEGIAVAAPVYFATGSKRKGIMWCFVAAIAEHLGALTAFAVVGIRGNHFGQAILYGLSSGMMATVTMKEIFPTAFTYANGRIYLVSNGALGGMVLMALSLSFFKHVGVQ